MTAKQERKRTIWPLTKVSFAGTIAYTWHLLMATFGAFVLGSVIVMFAAVLMALMFGHLQNQRLIDAIIEQAIFRVGLDNPYFAVPILCALVLGWLSGRSFESNSAAWVWVLPTLVLVWNIFAWKTYSSLSYWADVRANFFTADCGATDCLYELTVTAPFYTSVAYSIGRVSRNIANRVRRR